MFTLNKKLMKRLKWAAIAGVAMDVAMFSGGYVLYHQMTKSRDFRFKVYNYDSRILDAYYRANEKYGDGKKRYEDLEAWNVKKVDSFKSLWFFGL